MREPEWRRLEAILNTAENGSLKSLSDEDLLALPVLYRGALSSLSVARETSLDLELVTYLEGLSARAYFFVYGVRTTAGQRLASFFASDWPAAVRSLGKETLAALALTIVGACLRLAAGRRRSDLVQRLRPGRTRRRPRFQRDARISALDPLS